MRGAGIEVRVNLPLWPQLLDCPSLEMATVTRLSKFGDGQATMTVTVPQDSNKRKVQRNEGASHAKRPCRGGKFRGDEKQTE